MKGFLLVFVVSINVWCIYQIEHLITGGLDYYFVLLSAQAARWKAGLAVLLHWKERIESFFLSQLQCV